jgi:Trk-type K+ transport system membrane component
MLLFLMGVDLPTIGLIVLLLLVFGRLIFWLSKKLFRTILKDSSDEKVKLLSRVSAFILSPIIVIGSLALFIYISVQTVPRESDEEMERNHYEMMEEDISEDLREGMSKTEVVGLFGEADTTQSVLVYDLSLKDAKEKYLLEITFDTKGLKDFKRQR